MPLLDMVRSLLCHNIFYVVIWWLREFKAKWGYLRSYDFHKMAVEFREKCRKVHISINSIYRILKEINWRSVRMFVDFRGDFLENKTKRRYSCIYFFTSVLFFLQKSGSFSASGGCRHPWQAGRDGVLFCNGKRIFIDMESAVSIHITEKIYGSVSLASSVSGKMIHLQGK